MRPYSIRTPQFEVTSGGIRVLYGLYGWLLAKGQIVYLNTKVEPKDFVGIYPDIYDGNDMEADIVVRYLLNKPGTMGLLNPATGNYDAGRTKFDVNDKIYFFSKVFDTIGVDDDHILFLPILNLHIFKDYGNKRTKKAVFLGKGEHKDITLHPEDCIPFDRKFAQDQQRLADFLNECEVVYMYDQVTAMYEIARLCGCRIVIFPTGIEKDTFELYETGMNGISWGKDEGVELDVESFRKRYVELGSIFNNKLDKFITDTQK
jgi:hypothetical protein